MSQILRNLKATLKSEVYKQSLSITKKILNKDPTCSQVIKTQIICYILLNDFESGSKVTGAEDYTFEYCYCLYRLGKLDEAFSILEKSKPKWSKSGKKENYLLAQILYKLEKFSDSRKIYEVLDTENYEKVTNHIAAALQSKIDSSPSESLEKICEKAASRKGAEHALLFNVSLARVFSEKSDTKANHSEAIKMLEKAKKKGKKVLKEEFELTEEEISKELADFDLLKSYITPKEVDIANDNRKKSQKSLEEKLILANRRSLTQSEEPQKRVFQALKDFKFDVKSLSMLSLSQRRSIALNRSLVYLYSGQTEKCMKQLEKPMTESEVLDEMYLIGAGKIDFKLPSGSSSVAFYLAKSLADNKEAENNFRLIDEPFRYLPVVVKRFLEFLSEVDADNPERKNRIIKESIKYWENLDSGESDLNNAENRIKTKIYSKRKNYVNNLCLIGAEFMVTGNHLKEAEFYCDALVKSGNLSLDTKETAKLVQLLSSCNAGSAFEMVKQPIFQTSKNNDIDKLISSRVSDKIARKKFSRKRNLSDAAADSKNKDTNKNIVKEKKKESDLDPERWIPLKQRSYYKKKVTKAKPQLKSGRRGRQKRQNK